MKPLSNLSKLMGIIFLSIFFILLSVSVQGFDSDDDKSSDDSRFLNNLTNIINGSNPLGNHGGLDFSFYNIFTSFVNQTRQTFPDIVHHSNFTLIQLGLLCAIGSMAAGVATIAVEAFVFRQHETDVENYKRLQHGHTVASIHSRLYEEVPSLTYGTDSDPVLGKPQDNNNNYDKTNSRKKRDVEIDSSSYPQVVKSYLRNKGNPGESFLQLPSFSNPLLGYPAYGYNSRYLANNAYQLSLLEQQYPFAPQSNSRRSGTVDKLRDKMHRQTSDAEFSRGLPIRDIDFRKDNTNKKRKRVRINSESELNDDYKNVRFRMGDTFYGF